MAKRFTPEQERILNEWARTASELRRAFPYTAASRTESQGLGYHLNKEVDPNGRFYVRVRESDGSKDLDTAYTVTFNSNDFYLEYGNPADREVIVNFAGSSGGGGDGVSDHGALTGLADDDHSQYLLASDVTDRVTFSANWTDLTDAGATILHKHDHGTLDGLPDNDHPQYARLLAKKNNFRGIIEAEAFYFHIPPSGVAAGVPFEIYRDGSFLRFTGYDMDLHPTNSFLGQSDGSMEFSFVTGLSFHNFDNTVTLGVDPDLPGITLGSNNKIKANRNSINFVPDPNDSDRGASIDFLIDNVVSDAQARQMRVGRDGVWVRDKVKANAFYFHNGDEAAKVSQLTSGSSITVKDTDGASFITDTVTFNPSDFYLTGDSSNKPVVNLVGDRKLDYFSSVVINNTANETDIVNFTVPAGLMGRRGYLRVTLRGSMQQVTGFSRTYTFKIYWNDELIYNSSPVATVGTSPAFRSVRSEIDIVNLDDTSKQIMNGYFSITGTVSATLGDGGITAGTGGGAPIGSYTKNGFLTADTSLPVNFRATLTPSFAANNYTFYMLANTAQVFN